MSKSTKQDNSTLSSAKSIPKDINALNDVDNSNLDNDVMHNNDNVAVSNGVESMDNKDSMSTGKGASTDSISQATSEDDNVQAVSGDKDATNGVTLSDDIDNDDIPSASDGKELASSDEQSCNIDAVDTVDDDKNIDATSLPYTLNEDDLGDEPPLSYLERVEKAMANRPKEVCTRDGAMDDKLSKYSTIACIPFFVAGIVVTIFNKAKYRSPWAFLLIGLAVFALAIGSWLRYRNNKKCTCSVCETQAKNLRNSVILWGALGVCCIIAFAIFLVINLRAGMI